jgi:hypothetical protein
MTDDIVTLRFTNIDAGSNGVPDVVTMRIDRGSVPHVMDWYGAFYAGDDYDVRLNGRKLKMGINGEFVASKRKVKA